MKTSISKLWIIVLFCFYNILSPNSNNTNVNIPTTISAIHNGNFTTALLASQASNLSPIVSNLIANQVNVDRNKDINTTQSIIFGSIDAPVHVKIAHNNFIVTDNNGVAITDTNLLTKNNPAILATTKNFQTDEINFMSADNLFQVKIFGDVTIYGTLTLGDTDDSNQVVNILGNLTIHGNQDIYYTSNNNSSLIIRGDLTFDGSNLYNINIEGSLIASKGVVIKQHKNVILGVNILATTMTISHNQSIRIYNDAVATVGSVTDELNGPISSISRNKTRAPAGTLFSLAKLVRLLTPVATGIVTTAVTLLSLTPSTTTTTVITGYANLISTIITNITSVLSSSDADKMRTMLSNTSTTLTGAGVSATAVSAISDTLLTQYNNQANNSAILQQIISLPVSATYGVNSSLSVTTGFSPVIFLGTNDDYQHAYFSSFSVPITITNSNYPDPGLEIKFNANISYYKRSFDIKTVELTNLIINSQSHDISVLADNCPNGFNVEIKRYPNQNNAIECSLNLLQTHPVLPTYPTTLSAMIPDIFLGDNYTFNFENNLSVTSSNIISANTSSFSLSRDSTVSSISLPALIGRNISYEIPFYATISGTGTYNWSMAFSGKKRFTVNSEGKITTSITRITDITNLTVNNQNLTTIVTLDDSGNVKALEQNICTINTTDAINEIGRTVTASTTVTFHPYAIKTTISSFSFIYNRTSNAIPFASNIGYRLSGSIGLQALNSWSATLNGSYPLYLNDNSNVAIGDKVNVTFYTTTSLWYNNPEISIFSSSSIGSIKAPLYIARDNTVIYGGDAIGTIVPSCSKIDLETLRFTFNITNNSTRTVTNSLTLYALGQTSTTLNTYCGLLNNISTGTLSSNGLTITSPSDITTSSLSRNSNDNTVQNITVSIPVTISDTTNTLSNLSLTYQKNLNFKILPRMQTSTNSVLAGAVLGYLDLNVSLTEIGCAVANITVNNVSKTGSIDRNGNLTVNGAHVGSIISAIPSYTTIANSNGTIGYNYPVDVSVALTSTNNDGIADVWVAGTNNITATTGSMDVNLLTSNGNNGFTTTSASLVNIALQSDASTTGSIALRRPIAGNGISHLLSFTIPLDVSSVNNSAQSLLMNISGTIPVTISSTGAITIGSVHITGVTNVNLNGASATGVINNDGGLVVNDEVVGNINISAAVSNNNVVLSPSIGLISTGNNQFPDVLLLSSISKTVSVASNNPKALINNSQINLSAFNAAPSQSSFNINLRTDRSNQSAAFSIPYTIGINSHLIPNGTHSYDLSLNPNTNMAPSPLTFTINGTLNNIAVDTLGNITNVPSVTISSITNFNYRGSTYEAEIDSHGNINTTVPIDFPIMNTNGQISFNSTSNFITKLMSNVGVRENGNVIGLEFLSYFNLTTLLDGDSTIPDLFNLVHNMNLNALDSTITLNGSGSATSSASLSTSYTNSFYILASINPSLGYYRKVEKDFSISTSIYGNNNEELSMKVNCSAEFQLNYTTNKPLIGNVKVISIDTVKLNGVPYPVNFNNGVMSVGNMQIASINVEKVSENISGYLSNISDRNNFRVVVNKYSLYSSTIPDVFGSINLSLQPSSTLIKVNGKTTPNFSVSLPNEDSIYASVGLSTINPTTSLLDIPITIPLKIKNTINLSSDELNFTIHATITPGYIGSNVGRNLENDQVLITAENILFTPQSGSSSITGSIDTSGNLIMNGDIIGQVAITAMRRTIDQIDLSLTVDLKNDIVC